MYLLTHSLSPVLVLVAVMDPKVLKTKISHTHSLILSRSLNLSHQCAIDQFISLNQPLFPSVPLSLANVSSFQCIFLWCSASPMAQPVYLRFSASLMAQLVCLHFSASAYGSG